MQDQGARVMRDWAKSRLDEMNAALKSVEKQMSQLGEGPRRQVEEAMQEMQRQRDFLAAQMNETQQWSMAAYEGMKGKMESAWIEFERAAQKAIDVEHHERKNFEARASAQMQSWHSSMWAFQKAAMDLAARQREDLDQTLEAMKDNAQASRHKFDAMSKAGIESWAAFSQALDDSRQALERANMAAYDAWKKASGG